MLSEIYKTFVPYIQKQRTFVEMMRAVTTVSVVTVQEGNAMETAETAIAEAVIVKG